MDKAALVYPARLPGGQKVRVEIYLARWQGQQDHVIIKPQKWER